MLNSEYSVICDRCHGRMIIDGVLCPKCHGDGRIMITERRRAWPIRLALWIRDRWLWMKLFSWM